MTYPSSYHQTTNVTVDALRRFQRAAKTQDEKVMGWFNSHVGQALTASQVHKGLMQIGVIPITTPLTSIRRAMSNMVNAGRLVKTDGTRMGLYGRPEHLYKLPAGQRELFL